MSLEKKGMRHELGHEEMEGHGVDLYSQRY